MNQCIFAVTRAGGGGVMRDFATEITLLALCLYHELVIIHSIPDFPVNIHKRHTFVQVLKTSLKTSQYQLSSPGGPVISEMYHFNLNFTYS